MIPGADIDPSNVFDIVGGEFLDPWDAAQLAAVVAGWERQTQSVQKEIRQARAAVRDIEADLEAGVGLDDVARDAERARLLDLGSVVLQNMPPRRIGKATGRRTDWLGLTTDRIPGRRA